MLKIGRTVYVGATLRTNEAGIDQLRSLLAPRRWDVVSVPVTKVLHLKSGVTAVPDGTVVGYEPLVDDTAAYPVFLPVPKSTARRSWCSTPAPCSCLPMLRRPPSCTVGADSKS